MNMLQRWLKFNLVGILGMALQLSVLSLLTRLYPHNYLAATVLAVELTILHNFAWHRRYTWRDRAQAGSALPQLLRFHLSNGLVSLCGNLALMDILVHTVHLPFLAADAIAILCCSIANFFLADLWALATRNPTTLHVGYMSKESD